MRLLTTPFGKQDAPDTAALKTAVEYAVSAVDPLLMQTSAYPDRYIRPVSVALEYARQLADTLPGPVDIDRDAYIRDALVHALFPDINAISDAITSSLAMQEYLRTPPPGSELYALMGMRRIDKKLMGMKLVGSTLQREVAQQATYFTSHTIESPAPDESLTRKQIATQFFRSIVSNVKARIAQRRQNKEGLLTEIRTLLSRQHSASNIKRAAIAERVARLENGLQSILKTLEPDHYLSDFEAVLLHPEKYLYLNQTSITLDSMGIHRSAEETEMSKEHMLSELIGYDRRDWTVTIVRCSNLQYESFAEKLDKAYRYLTI